MNNATPLDLAKRMAKIDSLIELTVFGAPALYNVEQLAQRIGVAPEHAYNLGHWVDHTPLSADEVKFSDIDAQAAAEGLMFAAYQGFSEAEFGDFVRSISLSMERLTARQVEALVQKIAKEENVSDTEARLRAGERAPALTQELLPLVEHVYRRQFVNAIRRLTVTAIAQRGLHDEETAYPLVRAVGFADIVNFSSLVEKATPTELSEIVRSFQSTCLDIVKRFRGRVVNFIGDKVFFTTDNISDAAQIALLLADENGLGNCGTARVGLVWYRVITAEGDLFGPGVNLASRLCDAAEPATVLVDAKAAALLNQTGEFKVTSLPDIELRGIGTVTPSLLQTA